MSHMTISFSEIVIIAITAAVLAGCGRSAAASPPAPAPMGMTGCHTMCGHISVPYPFGMGPARCHHHSPGFKLTCDNTTNPPLLLLGGGGLLQVETFIVSESMVLVRRTPGQVKVDGDGNGALFAGSLPGDDDHGAYIMLTDDANELILVGCNVRATLKTGDGATVSACSSLCRDGQGVPYVPSRLDSSMVCTGVGCCQAPIVASAAAVDVEVQLEWFGRNRSADEERMPTRVFVAREGWFANKQVSNRLLLQEESSMMDMAVAGVPVLLSWEVDAAHSSSSSHSHVACDKGTRGGYTCRCDSGYDGNPYIRDGCQDINECELPLKYWCPNGNVCTNKDGGFDCGCPPGTRGNNTLPGGCLASVSVAEAEGGKCNTSCGDVVVHYPFGIGPSHCYRPGFNLSCHYPSGGEPARLLLDSYGNIQVQEISIPNNTLRVTTSFSIMGAISRNDFYIDFNDYVTGLVGILFSLSTRNELILSGCNVQATLHGNGNDPTIMSGCATFCSVSDVNAGRVPVASNKNCYGISCCQARISESIDGGMPGELSLKFTDLNNFQDNTSRPPFALIAEEGWFDNHLVSSQQMHALQSKSRFTPKVPIVLEWKVLQAVGLRHVTDHMGLSSHLNCPMEIAADICRSKYSQCIPAGKNKGYSCHCRKGYHGNPYKPHGCKGGTISYKGIIAAIIGVVCGIGLIFFILTSHIVSKEVNHRRVQMTKRKFFMQNHDQLLQQLVSQSVGIAENMIITLEELEKATHHFDKDLVIGGGGHGTVYKGILSNQHVVAIKKPKKMVQKEINEIINEVAILSQINHRNVVKLYGCCLETEVPMLVYEFIPNGTLYEHLHAEGSRSLSWDDRLRIAIETCKSLVYLHSATSVPIIHRDIKSANILLDDTLTAKVADFGASRYIPMEKSGLETMPQGTKGYWDPMYFYTGRLTDKSDLYSFGVLLVELLTRKKPFSYLSSNDEGLVLHFVTLFAEGNLLEILDPQVIEEGGKEAELVATIAIACIKLRGEDRPSMRQVELTLEGFHMGGHKTYNVLSRKVVPKNNAIDVPCNKGGTSSVGSTRCYSMEEEFILSQEYPR